MAKIGEGTTEEHKMRTQYSYCFELLSSSKNDLVFESLQIIPQSRKSKDAYVNLSINYEY